MQRKMFMAVAVALALSASSVPSSAQATAPAQGPEVSLDASDLTLSAVAASLTQKAGIPVLVDGTATTHFSGSMTQMPLEQVLSAVTKATGASWRKVFIPETTSTKDELEKAKQQAALLDQIEAVKAMVVYDPESKSQLTLVKSETDSAQASASAKELGLKPVYLLIGPEAPPPAAVTKAAAPVSANATGYADLSHQQDQAFLQMTPQERVQALERSMADDVAMNPTDRKALMDARMQAYRALRNSNSPTYQQWRETQREMWRGSRGGDARGRNRGSTQNSNGTRRTN